MDDCEENKTADSESEKTYHDMTCTNSIVGSTITTEDVNEKENVETSNISTQSKDTNSSHDVNDDVKSHDDVTPTPDDANIEKLVNPSISCKTCGVEKCPIWRRGDGKAIICNLCHIKRQKASLLSAHMKNSVNCTQKTSKETPNIRTSTRKNKAKKKFPNSIYNDRIVKNGNVKNRRNMFKKRPAKSVDDSPSVIATNAVYHDGLLYQVGDIVSTNDLDGGTYYAQIRGFLQDNYCEKSVAVTWLIPLKANQDSFDPMLFTPSYEEEKARPMSCFNFVCRAPSDLYKSRILHPPLQRTCSNLENLFTAANLALQVTQ